MKSSHCQSTVSEAVKNAGGRVTSIAPTQVEISAADGQSLNIIEAIEKAGYRITSKI